MEETQTLLLAMSYAARDSALKSLTDEGKEVFRMIELAARGREVPASTTEAWVEAGATASLAERDRDILVGYVARMSLIENFDEEAEA